MGVPAVDGNAEVQQVNVFAIFVRTVDHLQQIKQVPVQGWPF